MSNIQRKFLVSADIERWLEEETNSEEKSEQFYLSEEAGTFCFYNRYFPHTFSKTIVDKEGREAQSSVSEEAYKNAREKHVGRVLVKKSYFVRIDNSTFVVEKYLEKLKDLYILYAYFQDEKTLRTSKTLSRLQAFVLKEIDQDEKYSDKVLALFSKPMEYDLYRFYEKIDAFESANLFFWQVPARVYVNDGVCLVLYRNMRLLNHYKISFGKKHFASTLHRVRVILRRTATLLETFPDLFEPNVQHFCQTLLLRHYDETKALRYLYFLDELCTTKEEAKLTLYSELKSSIAEEEKSVTAMLYSQAFVQMMNMLIREIKLQRNHKYNSLKKEVKGIVREQLTSLEMLLAKTKDGTSDDSLEEIYLSIDALHILLEDFFHILGAKEVQIIIDELNILLKPLREYRNCKERATILSKMKAASQTKNLDTDPLLCEHETELKEKIDNALKLLRTSKFYI